VRLDCRDHRLALKRAAAALAAARARSTLAEKQLTRARRLHRDKNVSEELVNQREAERTAAVADVDAAAAGRDQAALEVERCSLRAPFDGVVTARLGQVGQRAAPGTPLIQLLDRTHLEVSAQIPVDNVADLHEARKVWLDAGGQRYPLKLRTVAPAIDAQARSREARFTFAGAAALPGAAGRVVWQSPLPHLPPNLVVRRGQALGVFVARDGRARFVPLPGAQEGQPAPAELPADTRLITDGRYSLSDGAPIRVAQ
jgi:RND family efflux transporter MFP subunit